MTPQFLITHKRRDNFLAALASMSHRAPYRVRPVHGAPNPFAGLQAFKMNVYGVLDGVVNRCWFDDRLLAISFALQYGSTGVGES